MWGPVSSVHLGNTQYANTFIGRQKTCTFKWQRATSTNKLVFYRCLMHAGRTMKIAWMIQRNSIEWALVVHPPHRVDVGKLEIGMREIRFARNQWIWASANKSNRIIVEMGNHELDQFYATPCNGSKTQFIASLCVLIGIWCWFECDGNGSVRTKQKKKNTRHEYIKNANCHSDSSEFCVLYFSSPIFHFSANSISRYSTKSSTFPTLTRTISARISAESDDKSICDLINWECSLYRSEWLTEINWKYNVESVLIPCGNSHVVQVKPLPRIHLSIAVGTSYVYLMKNQRPPPMLRHCRRVCARSMRYGVRVPCMHGAICMHFPFHSLLSLAPASPQRKHTNQSQL